MKLRRWFQLRISSLAPLALISGLVLTGCGRGDKIEVYRVPKETPAAPMPPMSASMDSNLPAGHPAVGNPAADNSGMGSMAGMDMGEKPTRDIDWTVPAGWVEQAPSTMRIGSFLIKGSNGQQADMSVVPLAGEAGGDLANINRWRGQINLQPISDSQLAQQSETIEPAGRRMLFVDFVSDAPLINNQYKKRLMAAIYKSPERTYFFKMIGEDSTVESARPAYMKFLKSLRFQAHAS